VRDRNKPLSKFEFDEIFTRKFKRAYKHVADLDSLVEKKHGVFFVSHVYSIDELMTSEHHAQIYSISEKIGSDAMNWYQAGDFPSWGVESYLKKRNELEKRLEQLNQRIRSRRPTSWEKIRGTCEAFVRIIASLLPRLLRGLIPGSGLVPLKLPFKDE
jgi:hypothetical protein